MQIIINNSSMQPIYEQIANQIKQKILNNELITNASLPSVRTLAKELHISALTVKKAYDLLEYEGFIKTIQGKGSFVSNVGSNLMLEEKKKEVETELEKVILKGRSIGMSNQDIVDLFNLIIED